jgi:hypothetical protein
MPVEGIMKSALYTTLFCLALAAPASAIPVTYSFTFNGPNFGWIDNSSFSSSDMTVTLVGDTSNVDVFPSNYPITSTFVDIPGVGAGSFTYAVSIGRALPEGIQVVGGGDYLIYIPVSSPFPDLVSNFGPTTFTSPFLGIAPGTWDTTLGKITMDVTTATFEVTVDNSGPPVPEPSTFILLGVGLASVAFMNRRTRK